MIVKWCSCKERLFFFFFFVFPSFMYFDACPKSDAFSTSSFCHYLYGRVQDYKVNFKIKYMQIINKLYRCSVVNSSKIQQCDANEIRNERTETTLMKKWSLLTTWVTKFLFKLRMKLVSTVVENIYSTTKTRIAPMCLKYVIVQWPICLSMLWESSIIYENISRKGRPCEIWGKLTKTRSGYLPLGPTENLTWLETAGKKKD